MSMREIIETKLREALAPTHLPVVNQSHKHHASRGSEKHFRVVVVAEAFAGRPRVRPASRAAPIQATARRAMLALR